MYSILYKCVIFCQAYLSAFHSSYSTSLFPTGRSDAENGASRKHQPRASAAIFKPEPSAAPPPRHHFPAQI